MVAGVLFEIPKSEWRALRRKEGLELNPPAYRQIDIRIYSVAAKAYRSAATFVVDSPERDEQIPSLAYIDDMIAQTEGRKLIAYSKFLRWIRKSVESHRVAPLREGLFVRGTTERADSRGRYIVRANPSYIHISEKARLVSVDFDGHITIAAFQPKFDLPADVCEVDQNLRNALGMEGLNCYGHTVQLGHVAEGSGASRIAHPRNLCLKVRQTNWTDSEKRICVLHPNNISLLGVEEGEHVEIECATRRDDGSVAVKTIKLRAYSSKRRQEQVHDYPEAAYVYLDRECRTELGLEVDRVDFVDWPVLVRPSISHLLRRRIAIYGITFFLGTASLSQIFALLLPVLGGPIRAAIAITTAIVATVAVTIIDMRSKVSYN